MGDKRLDEQYVVVTTISTHRIRYCIPLSELQKTNPDVKVSPEWAKDCVVCEELEEFSQDHLGELIVDTDVLSEDEVLQLFDEDNDYLSGWDKETKLKNIHDCWFDKKPPYKKESERFDEYGNYGENNPPVSPVFEKGYPSFEAVNQQREGYYDYMLRRTREEDEKMKNK